MPCLEGALALADCCLMSKACSKPCLWRHCTAFYTHRHKRKLINHMHACAYVAAATKASCVCTRLARAACAPGGAQTQRSRIHLRSHGQHCLRSALWAASSIPSTAAGATGGFACHSLLVNEVSGVLPGLGGHFASGLLRFLVSRGKHTRSREARQNPSKMAPEAGNHSKTNTK